MEGWHVLFALLVLVSAGHLVQWWFVLWVEGRIKRLERLHEGLDLDHEI